jgi:hypothetical protein
MIIAEFGADVWQEVQHLCGLQSAAYEWKASMFYPNDEFFDMVKNLVQTIPELSVEKVIQHAELLCISGILINNQYLFCLFSVSVHRFSICMAQLFFST